MKEKRLFTTALLALLLLALLVVPGVFAENGEPLPGTVGQTATYVFYPPTTLAVTSTVYSAAPRTVSGQNVADIRKWNSADVFLTVDVTGSKTTTVTPQFSADQTNWADATYTVVSGTTASEITHQIILTSDSTDYLRIPIAGQYLRFKIAVTGGGSVTPTILATLRNN